MLEQICEIGPKFKWKIELDQLIEGNLSPIDIAQKKEKNCPIDITLIK